MIEVWHLKIENLIHDLLVVTGNVAIGEDNSKATQNSSRINYIESGQYDVIYTILVWHRE